MPRLFVALRPPPSIRDLLADTMIGVPEARWQDDEQLHLTLRFIGDVDHGVAEDVAIALGGVRSASITARITGVGRFERRGRVHTLWAGITPREPLAALHAKVDAALIRCGLPPEGRAYQPHVTVARLNAPEEAVRGWLAAHGGLASEPFTMEAMLLFESHLGKAGASYEAVARYPLRV